MTGATADGSLWLLAIPVGDLIGLTAWLLLFGGLSWLLGSDLAGHARRAEREERARERRARAAVLAEAEGLSSLDRRDGLGDRRRS